jgi:hypothetical protein
MLGQSGVAGQSNVIQQPAAKIQARRPSVQIAIRLPAADIAQAREITGRRRIGYQTLLKIFVREGLMREARRR